MEQHDGMGLSLHRLRPRPGPAAATRIDGGLAQQVASAGIYTNLAHGVYIDVGGYHTMGAHLQKSLDVNPADEAQVNGLAPYWRIALEQPFGGGMGEVGAFELNAKTFPCRERSAGHDRVVDFGLDAQYQFSTAKSDTSAILLWIDEHPHWTASNALGATTRTADTLRSFKGTVHYLFDKAYGFTAQYFALSGTQDPLRYTDARTGSPNSNGEVFQVDYLPFNKGSGPTFWPHSSVKISLQNVTYHKFDGARTNYDGAGRRAQDNNTLYLETWITF